MFNINFCNCSDQNSRKRHHHGVICTKCNPALIEPLFVPEEIKAYRTWNFSVESGFIARGNGRIQSWNDFNSSPPPGVIAGDLHSAGQPWQPPAICIYNNHIAPDPYCSCGYYSVKNFGVIGSHFSHDSTKEIVSRFRTNVIYTLQNKLPKKQLISFANLFFHSPLLKTLEIDNFKILSEVSLTGKVIECEKGYRSEKIQPRKFYLLVNFFDLNVLSEELGSYINKDPAEAINSTIVWIDFLNKYLKGIANNLGYDFELLVKVNKNNPIDSEIMSRAEHLRRSADDSGYLSFEHDLYINQRLRGIADTVLISNKILKKQPFFDLEEITHFEKEYIKNLDNPVQIHEYAIGKTFRTLPKTDINFSRILRQKRYHQGGALDNFQRYQEKILAFGILYLNLINYKNNYKEIINSDFSEIFGFRYKLFLDNYQSKEGFDPQKWFPLLNYKKTDNQRLQEKG